MHAVRRARLLTRVALATVLLAGCDLRDAELLDPIFGDDSDEYVETVRIVPTAELVGDSLAWIDTSSQVPLASALCPGSFELSVSVDRVPGTVEVRGCEGCTDHYNLSFVIAIELAGDASTESATVGVSYDSSGSEVYGSDLGPLVARVAGYDAGGDRVRPGDSGGGAAGYRPRRLLSLHNGARGRCLRSSDYESAS